MPSEIVTEHVEITSVGPDWYIAQDGAVSAPVMGVSQPDRSFWDNATVSWEGGDFDDLWIQTFGGFGWGNFFIWPASANGATLASLMDFSTRSEMANNYTTVDDIENPSTLGGLRWQLRTGTSMPTSILIEGDFEYEHVYGRDPDDFGLANYTMRTVEGDDISTWIAPSSPQVRDNELFVGGIVRTGYDHDVEGDYYTITMYGRDIVVGDITGEYLGADRRFMGF